MSELEYIHLDVDKIKKETDNAFLLVIKDKEIWVPRSLISDADDYEEGDKNCVVSVKEWWWKDKQETMK